MIYWWSNTSSSRDMLQDDSLSLLATLLVSVCVCGGGEVLVYIRWWWWRWGAGRLFCGWGCGKDERMIMMCDEGEKKILNMQISFFFYFWTFWWIFAISFCVISTYSIVTSIDVVFTLFIILFHHHHHRLCKCESFII